MALDITKKYTDNPFLDNLIYYVQQIAYSCILKDESVALANETEESSAAAEKYIYSMDGSGTFRMYDYTEQMMAEAGVPDAFIPTYLNNLNDVPPVYQEALVKVARKHVIDEYEEKNNYYRMITGLQPYGEVGIPVAPYMYLIPSNETVTASYVHELGYKGARMFEKYGALDAIKADYPDAKYLNFITAGIDIYKARRAVDKQILYSKSCGVVEIDDLFQDKFEIARIFVDRAVKSDAMEYNSEHYNAFLCMYILFLTINDCVVELQDRIVKKDILDNRCCKYIFEMYGVPYYDSIPLKYQIILVKNINALVQYKSSPRDMLNLIMFFQAKDIQINKYFLMRNRKYDEFGNVILNTTEFVDSIENTILKHTTSVKENVNLDNAAVTIPWPFLCFLNKGNKMYVWVDNVKQARDVDYIIYDYDKIKFPNLTGTHTVRFEFYYDTNTEKSELKPDTSNPVKVHTEYFESTDPTVGVYNYTLTPPYSTFLTEGNDIIVSIDTVILNPSMYTVNASTNTLSIDRNVEMKDRDVSVLYIYSDNGQTKFRQGVTIASTDNQVTFAIPEPFKYYVIHGNEFFVTIGTVYVDPRRYTIDYLNCSITFTDGTTVYKDRSVVFHFVYNSESVYDLINIVHSSETVTATQRYQTEFTLTPPIADYYSRGFKVYVELLGWYLDDSYFQVYGNKLILNNLNMGLEIGDKITFHYFYTPVNKHVKTISKYYHVDTPFQTKFTIDFPDEDYLEKGNKLIIDSAGIPLTIGTNCSISGNTLTILDTDYAPYTGQKLCVEYIYTEEIENSIKIFQTEEIVCHENPTKVWMDMPFYPYQETGHGVVAINHSTYVPDICKTIKDYSPYMEIVDGVAELNEPITFLYFCNKRYWLEKERLITVKETTKTVNDIVDGILEVPEPFNDFIVNEWPWFIDSKKVWMDENKYDLVNSAVAFVDDKTAKQLQSFTFTFLYKNCAPWLVIDKETDGGESNEDVEKDFDLYFLGMPLSTFTELSSIIKKQERVKSYDMFAIGDKFWHGPDDSVKKNQSRYHEVKTAILKKKFNYARTKYLTVDYLMDVSEASFQIAYFYNMLWDDVFKENKLNVNVPSLSNYHEFNIGHLFCYMTALMYVFQKMEDKIFVKPSQILYARGFNFKADLKELKQWVLDQRRLPSDYDVFGFMNPDPEFVDLDQFVQTYNTNANIYKTICNGLINANTYDIWRIWKKLYDSLMIWEFNLEYFKLSDGRQATTFTEFLKEKDSILYESIIDIQNIADDNTRRDTIIGYIQDIVYILDAWIDSDKFAYIYDQFPGSSQRYLLEYLFTMINFFKSYKVYLYQMTVELKFTDLGDQENYIRPNDVHTMRIYLNKPDYISPREVTASQMHTLYKDCVSPRDVITFRYVYAPSQVKVDITGRTVVVSGESKYDLTGSLTIPAEDLYYWNDPHSKYMGSDIIGNINVAKSVYNNNNELTGTIKVAKEVTNMPKITGNMKVCVLTNPADISGTITIPTPVTADITGSIDVAVYLIHGSVSVVVNGMYNWNDPTSKDVGATIDGTVDVENASSDATIDGTVSVPHIKFAPSIDGTMDVSVNAPNTDVSGTIDVKVPAPDVDYSGEVSVSHPISFTMVGNMNVPNVSPTSEVNGTVVIPAPVPSEEISGYITVAEPDTYYI